MLLVMTLWEVLNVTVRKASLEMVSTAQVGHHLLFDKMSPNHSYLQIMMNAVVVITSVTQMLTV